MTNASSKVAEEKRRLFHACISGKITRRALADELKRLGASKHFSAAMLKRAERLKKLGLGVAHHAE